MNWIFLAFISAIFSATAAISQKKVLFSIEGLEFSFMVSCISTVFAIPFLLNVDYHHLEAVNLGILFLKTIPGTMAFLFVMLSLKNLEISKALPLLALTPGLVAIFAFFILGDTISLMETGGIILLFTGTYLIETKAGQNILDPFRVFLKSRNHHYVIIALMLFTLTSIVDRYLLGRFKLEPSAFMGFQQLFMTLNFLVVMLWFKKKPFSLPRRLSDDTWKWIVFISALTIIYRYTEILAVKNAPVALVLSIKRTSVFFAVVIGGRLFKESNLLLKAAATAIIITGVILIAM
ncbi:MAG: EamA family transporter [Methanococcaceae archaeon]